MILHPWLWTLAIALHVLATLVWVGGMFFAHMALRPAAAALLAPPERLPLMTHVLGRFFGWVWLCIVLLWATGWGMLLFFLGGKPPAYIHAMMGTAFIMTLLFAYLWFLPYRRLKASVAATDWEAAGGHLAVIRGVITVNLVLGLITAVIGAVGRP